MGFVLKNKISVFFLVLLILPSCILTSFVIAVKANASAYNSFTVADEEKLGKEFDILIRSRLPLVQDPEIINYFSAMVQRLNENISPQPFEFKVSILNYNAVNAFAVPGGYIFINTGLITAMNEPGEVAAVLAHEMAHVTKRHIAGRIEASKAISFLSVIGMLAGAFLGGDVGQAAVFGSVAAGQAALLNYSRSDEAEADQVGLNYLIAAKYHPKSMVDAFTILQRPQWITGSNMPSYLSTHPDIASRINDINARIKSLLKLPVTEKERQERLEFIRIQTLVRGRYATPEVAQQFFNNQIKTEKDNIGKSCGYLGLALVLERKNQVMDAALAYQQAIDIDPDNSVTIREAGRFHYLKGNTKDAITMLAKAIHINPGDYMTLFYYARLLDDSGQSLTAMNYYKNILHYVPEDPEIHQYYAQALGKNNQLFLGNLHLAYSAMYTNNAQKTTQFYERAKKLVSNEQDKMALEIFDKKFKERRAYW
jgi:predicted Zn-dependent protease